jgi:cytidyltransferase-like protein
MDLSVAEKTIIAVLAYSSQFNHSLTQNELIERIFKPEFLSLLQDKKIKSRKINRDEFLLAINSLKKKKIIFQNKKELALSKEHLSKRTNIDIKDFKQEVVEDLVSLSKKIPWVLGVVITGSYAAGMIEREDDLDFLIITKKNRLWLTRLLFLFLSWIKGRRPHLPSGDLSHSWDFNFWLDETSLSMSEDKRSIYEAYEVLQTKWVVNKDSIKTRFFKQNEWVYDYFLFADLPEIDSYTESPKIKSPDMFLWLEKLAFFIQNYYRQIRHGKQNTSFHSAFFHQKSTRKNILDNWKKEYLKATSSKKVLVTGVFDVLHQEHKKFLKAAKKEGDYLIIGIETDSRVKKIKGDNRPVNNQEQRKLNLEKLDMADEVFILPREFTKKSDYQRLIKEVSPSILAVSAHSSHLDVKKKIMNECGGKVKVVLKHNPKFSSTKIINGSK